MYYFPEDSSSSSVKSIYSFASERGPIYIDNNGAKFALCQSTDGIKCDYLFAEISVLSFIGYLVFKYFWKLLEFICRKIGGLIKRAVKRSA